MLIDLCHTHTNAQIAAIKKKWEAKVSLCPLCTSLRFGGTTASPPPPVSFETIRLIFLKNG